MKPYKLLQTHTFPQILSQRCAKTLCGLEIRTIS